jgi:hypothetical protein
MSIFDKISYEIVSRLTQPRKYTEQEYREYQNGYATGYPLEGQPEYPIHDSVAYRRGLRYGRRSFEQAGRPTIKYEPPIEEE